MPFSSLSPYQCLGHTFFLEIIPGCKKGPKLGDLAFIYILTGWCLFFSLSHFKKTGKDGISRGQKETEQDSLKQQNPWMSAPLGSVRLPCGCNVFVRPSPLITIMFPKEYSRLFAKICMSVFAKVWSHCNYNMRNKYHIVTHICGRFYTKRHVLLSCGYSGA